MPKKSRAIRIALTAVALTGLTALARGGKLPPDVPVTTSIADFNAIGQAYTIQSEGGGAYQSGAGGVISILVANGYNGITWGDWRVDLLANPTGRAVGITFSATNAAQPGDPGYTAPANPPYWGTQLQPVRFLTKCTLENHDMYSMRPGDAFPCIGWIRMPDAGNVYYVLSMGNVDPKFDPMPETQELRVTCNASGADGRCSDWFLDPTPVVNPDGTTSSGQTRARLERYETKHNQTTSTNAGDFYLTFHVHITRP